MQLSKKVKKIIAESSIAAMITLLVIAGLHTPMIAGFFDGVDYSVLNNNQTIPSEDIVIVAIDEATINNPNFKSYKDISRSDYGIALKNLLEKNPKAIGVDVLFFNEADNGDLAQIAEENENVVFAQEYLSRENRTIKPHFDVENENQLGTVNMTTSSANKNNIINQASLISHAEPLSVKLWRAGNVGKQVADQNKTSYIVEAGRKSREIPISKNISGQNAININFFSTATHNHEKTYERVSFYDAYMGDLDSVDLSGKYILIGDTASDAHDTFITPTSHGVEMPGVEIHANFLQTIQADSFPAYQTETQKTLLLILLTIIILIICENFTLIGSGIFTLLIFAVLYFSWIYAYQNNNFIISITYPIFSLIVIWAGIYIYRFTIEEKQSRTIKESFSKYVSEDIVNQVIENPELVELGGQSLEVSVMFSDLEGFTSISENLTNKELLNLLNEYLDEMSKIILKYGGTIDKFMGDGIMSYLGAPLPKENHAALSCETALEQVKALQGINDHLEQRGLPRVNMRIGINTGMATAGNIGTKQKVEYTLIGDEINLGSRLESVNKRYGTNIIVSESSKVKCKDKFFFRELDFIRVKGKTKPVQIFELIAYAGEETESQKQTTKNYEEGLIAYRSQDWAKAEELFQKNKSDSPSENMLERIKKLKKDKLEKDWDGVYTFNSK